MKGTILLALALTFAVALGASANMLTDVTVWNETWGEDFSAYDPPPAGEVSFLTKILGRTDNCSNNPWDQWQLPQIKGVKVGGTDNAVIATACSATYQLRASWDNALGGAGGAAYQRVSLNIQTTATAASNYTINLVSSNNDVPFVENSNTIPMWDISSLAVRAHVRNSWEQAVISDWTGAETSIAAAGWHVLDLVWNLSTGDAEWYVDTTLVSTLPDDAALKAFFIGREANHFEFWQKYDALGATNVYFDNLKDLGGGVVPEPSSLIAFATFGIGAFGLIRRRRA